jgi:uncharacterized RDD family membrane protein YckC
MKNPPAAKKRPERGAARKSRGAAGRKETREPRPEAASGEVEEQPLLPQGTIMTRITARSIDGLVLILPFYFLLGASVTMEGDVVVSRNDVFLWLIAVVVVGYEVIFTGVWGWTPGKRLTGLAIVDPETGDSPGWAKAIMRSTPLLLVVTVLLIPVLWLACVIAMRLDKRQRSLFDFIGGTAVVLKARTR